jgi:nucleoside 2-deoxyribosyltransferase
MKKGVYLAGPITGLSYADARYTWRHQFASLLKSGGHDIECFSPMRQKDFLAGQQCEGDAKSLRDHDEALARPSGILTRDFNDVRSRDAVVACFLGAKRVSIGTVWEIGVAYSHKKPLVVVMEPGNLHDHLFITETAGYVVPTLAEAAHIIASLLSPGL